MSAPSIAKIASTPRCPLIANWAVKLVAPLVSVIVPAASSSKVLKSLIQGQLTHCLAGKLFASRRALALRLGNRSSPRSRV